MKGFRNDCIICQGFMAFNKVTAEFLDIAPSMNKRGTVFQEKIKI